MTDGVEVLFFFSGCFVRMTDGCHVRAWQDLEMLVATGRRVAVYSYRNHIPWPWRDSDIENFRARFPGVELLLDDWTFTLRVAQKIKSVAATVGGRFGRWAHEFQVPGASPQLDRVRRMESLRAVVVSYAWGVSQLNGRLPVRTIIDTHDLISLEEIQKGPAGQLTLARYLPLRKELFCLGLADEVWSISYAEFWFMQAFLGAGRVRLVPPALSSWTGAARVTNEEPRYDLVFVGSNNRWNGEALAGFFRSCADWNVPVTIGVAGGVCRNEGVRAAATKVAGAELLGFVDDLDGLYASARAAACPVEGTGTKIKLIEALRAGRPVFAAPGAMAGLVPGYEACVFPIERDIILRMLRDRAALASAQAAAIRYSQAYEFDRVADQVRISIGHRR